jgi:hypothetical protein
MKMFHLGRNNTKSFKLKENRQFGRVLLFILTISTFILNTGTTLIDALDSDIYILLHSQKTYDQKMDIKWPVFYNYMTFIKNNTPQNSTILIPPQVSPWLSTGNSALVRYFLYPRKLIHGGLDSIPLDGYDYIMISWGRWSNDNFSYGWPMVDIKAQELLYWDQDSNVINIVPGNYIYKDGGDIVKWGLIKSK